MLRMTRPVLSLSQKEVARQFSNLKKDTNFVRVTSKSTRGSVLFGTLAGDSSRPLDELLDLNGTAATQEAYKTKYREKLAEAAKQKGYSNVDDMLSDQRKKKQEEERMLSVSAEPTSVSSSSISSSTTTKSSTGSSSKNLPPSVKSLDDIVRLDLLQNESAHQIGEIWNTFHSTRSCLSACLDSSFYDSLLIKSKRYPMFVLPLPRDDGYEIFLLQFQGHQVFFTQLLEYQMKKENARPVLSVSFYNELAKEKGVVLMLGELANSDGPLSLKDAQNLIYQLQIFYVTGKDSQTKMVERFWENPTEFNYEDLIASLQTL